MLFCTWSRPSSLWHPFRLSLRCIIAFSTLCFSRSQPWPSCAKLKAECLRGETGKSQVPVLARRLRQLRLAGCSVHTANLTAESLAILWTAIRKACAVSDGSSGSIFEPDVAFMDGLVMLAPRCHIGGKSNSSILCISSSGLFNALGALFLSGHLWPPSHSSAPDAPA